MKKTRSARECEMVPCVSGVLRFADPLEDASNALSRFDQLAKSGNREQCTRCFYSTCRCFKASSILIIDATASSLAVRRSALSSP